MAPSTCPQPHAATSSAVGTQVHVRVRPLSGLEASDSSITKAVHLARDKGSDKTTVYLSLARGTGQAPRTTAFGFPCVHPPDASQLDVFDGTAFNAVRRALDDGYNSCIFAYGQTGSGKTHTMFGADGDLSTIGVVPRAARYLYQRLTELAGTKTVTMIWTATEVYNEAVYDLSVPPPTGKAKRPSLPLQDDKKGEFVDAPGQETVCLATFEHFMKWMKACQGRRTTASTRSNATSSRSHAIFTVRLHVQDTADPTQTYTARLQFCDLAGSELAASTDGLSAQNKTEGRNINLSLLALTNLLRKVSEKPAHQCQPAFRQAVLTRLLKGCIGGNCATVMLVCISPSSACAKQTCDALNYGVLAMKIIDGVIKRNVVLPGSEEDRAIQDEISRLKQQNDTLVEQTKEQHRVIEELKDEIEELKALRAVQTCSVGAGSGFIPSGFGLGGATPDGVFTRGTSPMQDGQPRTGSNAGGAALTPLAMDLVAASASPSRGNTTSGVMLSPMMSERRRASVLLATLEPPPPQLSEHEAAFDACSKEVMDQFERDGDLTLLGSRADIDLRKAVYGLAKLEAKKRRAQALDEAPDTFLPRNIVDQNDKIAAMQRAKAPREAQLKLVQEQLDQSMRRLTTLTSDIKQESSVHYAGLKEKVAQCEKQLEIMCAHNISRGKDNDVHLGKARFEVLADAAEFSHTVLQNAMAALKAAAPKAHARLVSDAVAATALLEMAKVDTAAMRRTFDSKMGSLKLQLDRVVSDNKRELTSPGERALETPLSCRLDFIEHKDAAARRRPRALSGGAAATTGARASSPASELPSAAAFHAARGPLPKAAPAARIRAPGDRLAATTNHVRFVDSLAGMISGAESAHSSTNTSVESGSTSPAAPPRVPSASPSRLVMGGVAASPAGPRDVEKSPPRRHRSPQHAVQISQGVPVPLRAPSFVAQGSFHGLPSGAASPPPQSKVHDASSSFTTGSAFTRSHTALPSSSVGIGGAAGTSRGKGGGQGGGSGGGASGLLHRPAHKFQREVTMTNLTTAEKENLRRAGRW